MNEKNQLEKSAATPPATNPQTTGPNLSPEVDAFISQMVENLNTHQPGVPRGMNTGNCQQPEFSPVPLTAPSPVESAQRSREGGNAKS